MQRRRLVGHPAGMDLSPTLPIRLRQVVIATVAVTVLSTSFATAAEARITKGFTPTLSQTISPGISYRFGRMTTTGGRHQQVFVGTVDPRNPNVRLKALLSNDRVVRRDLVSRIALRKQRPGFKPMIATNGDMSTRDRTDGYAAPHSMAVSNGELMVMPIREAREHFERAYLQQQLVLCEGKVGQLAKRVGMERTHLYRKLRSLGIDFKSLTTDD